MCAKLACFGFVVWAVIIWGSNDDKAERAKFQGVHLVKVIKDLLTKVIGQRFSRQTRKDALQLPQHNSLLGRSPIRLGDSVPNTNTRKTPRRVNDGSLRRKPRRSTSLDIRGSTAGRTINPRQDEFEIRRR